MKKHCYTLLVFVFSISSLAQSNTFIDTRDGKVYKTVKIGTQTWMAENLVFKADSNCWAYENDPNNVTKYGYLYNWLTAKTVCPAGWHLPCIAEFDTLIDNCNGSPEDVYKALLPGGSSGFSAPFGGWRFRDGSFGYNEMDASFWSSSPDREEYVFYLSLSTSSVGISSDDWEANIYSNYRSCGFSVRCLKNN